MSHPSGETLLHRGAYEYLVTMNTGCEREDELISSTIFGLDKQFNDATKVNNDVVLL